MKTIHKYLIKPNIELKVPIGAHLLDVAFQGDQLYLWAVVNPNEPKELLNIKVFGTGHPMPEDCNCEYVGTAYHDSGSLVLHVFKDCS